MDLNRAVGTKVLSNFCERVSKIEFSDIVNDTVLVSILPKHEREFLLDILNSRFDNLLKGALSETL